jgi:hypothetical protein
MSIDGADGELPNAAGWKVNLDEILGRKPIPKPKGDSRRDKWIRWIGAIDKDVNALAINRMSWRALSTIWRERSPQLPPSFLFNYFASTFAHTQASGIRRQVDSRPDVTSLRRLLAEMVEYPHCLSGTWFIGRYEWGLQHLGESEFLSLDPNNTGHVDPRFPAEDLERVVAAADGTRNWVNKHVAHLSVTPAAAVPTFDEIDAALDVIGDVFIRWNCILTGASLTSIEPFPQYDWLAPLRMPWITDETSSGPMP